MWSANACHRATRCGPSFAPRRTAAVYRTIARTPEEIVAPASTGAENIFQAARDQGVKRVVICPSMVLGPGDYRVTPFTQLVRDWLNGSGQTYKGGLNLVHVEDVAAAHVAALSKGDNGGRYIAGGENILVQDIGLLMKKLTGKKPLHMGLSRGPMLWSAKWGEHLSKMFGRNPPVTYDLVYEVSERYAFYNASNTNQTFGLTPKDTETTLRETISWLIHQGQVKPAVAARLKDQFPAPVRT